MNNRVDAATLVNRHAEERIMPRRQPSAQDHVNSTSAPRFPRTDPVAGLPAPLTPAPHPASTPAQSPSPPRT